MYKHKSGAAKRKKKAEFDAKNAKKPKIVIFFNSPNDDISENSFCVLICVTSSSSVTLSFLLLVNLMLILIS
jgi:hypothetical protein